VNEGISGDGVHPNAYAGCAPHCGSTDFNAAGLGTAQRSEPDRWRADQIFAW
jgi:hypothetical protein